MKKYQVIIASIIAALGITIVAVGTVKNNVNVEITEASNQVISGSVDKLDTEAKKKYNNYSTLLSEETKDRYELAVAKSRLNELSDECDDCCTMLGTYENKLHDSMYNYEYADAYKYIGYVLNNAINLHGIMVDHEELLKEYPVLGEGLFEGGNWLFTVDDRCDLDFLYKSYAKICCDTWFAKNYDLSLSAMKSDDSVYGTQYGALSGLIIIEDCGSSEWYKSSERYDIIYMANDTGNIVDSDGYYFNMDNTKTILSQMNETQPFVSLSESLFESDIMDAVFDVYYNELSAGLANDTNDSYRYKLKNSLNPFLYEAHRYAESADKDGCKYAIDKDMYKNAVIEDLTNEFRLGYYYDDEDFGAAFGYMKFNETGYTIHCINPVAITESDISTYGSKVFCSDNSFTEWAELF